MQIVRRYVGSDSVLIRSEIDSCSDVAPGPFLFRCIKGLILLIVWIGEEVNATDAGSDMFGGTILSTNDFELGQLKLNVTQHDS